MVSPPMRVLLSRPAWLFAIKVDFVAGAFHSVLGDGVVALPAAAALLFHTHDSFVSLPEWSLSLSP